MLVIVLIVASLSLLCGFLVGLVCWLVVSLNLALGIGAVTSILTFIGLCWLVRRIASECSPEDAVELMSDWLASPLECGERPESCEVVFDDEVPWPMDGTAGVSVSVRAFLCRYTFSEESENESGIGIVGPTVFSFLTLNWDAFTHEQLIQCYRGLFLALAFQAEDDDRNDLTKDEQKRLLAHLNRSGYEVSGSKFDRRTQSVRPPGGEALFAVEVEKNARKVIVVGDLGALDRIETRDTDTFNVSLAHYHWLDCWWLGTLPR